MFEMALPRRLPSGDLGTRSPSATSSSFPPISLILPLPLLLLTNCTGWMLLPQMLASLKLQGVETREIPCWDEGKEWEGIIEDEGEKTSDGSGGGKGRDGNLALHPRWKKGALCLQPYASTFPPYWFLQTQFSKRITVIILALMASGILWF